MCVLVLVCYRVPMLILLVRLIGQRLVLDIVLRAAVRLTIRDSVRVIIIVVVHRRVLFRLVSVVFAVLSLLPWLLRVLLWFL